MNNNIRRSFVAPCRVNKGHQKGGSTHTVNAVTIIIVIIILVLILIIIIIIIILVLIIIIIFMAVGLLPTFVS